MITYKWLLLTIWPTICHYIYYIRMLIKAYIYKSNTYMYVYDVWYDATTPNVRLAHVLRLMVSIGLSSPPPARWQSNESKLIPPRCCHIWNTQGSDSFIKWYTPFAWPRFSIIKYISCVVSLKYSNNRCHEINIFLVDMLFLNRKRKFIRSVIPDLQKKKKYS